MVMVHVECASAQTTRFDALADLPCAGNRPTPQTAEILQGKLLFRRATQAYLRALPPGHPAHCLAAADPGRRWRRSR